jgi:hypothetical protein
MRDEIARALQQAKGQGNFSADLSSNAGQRMLPRVAPGGSHIANSLGNRQAGRGRRTSDALAEGFDAPETAAQTENG